jgi:hypothetical protein
MHFALAIFLMKVYQLKAGGNLKIYVKYSSRTSGSVLPTDYSPQVWIFLLVILP